MSELIDTTGTNKLLTDVIRVELINPNERRESRGSQTPLGELSNDRKLARV